MTKTLFTFFILLTTLYSQKTCVYINSYHKGFVWSDTISKEINNVLKDSCTVLEFYMDSKRNKDEEFIKTKALEAKKFIEDNKADIVITSDDNAAKFLIKPYFKDTITPFIFCGVNWTAKEYGFPYKNVTGMIEVTPISELYKIAKRITKGNRAIFIGDNTLTDKKDLSKFIKYTKKHNVLLDSVLINNVDDWKKNYLLAQDKYDFIILGHNSAIRGWDDKNIKRFLLNNSKKLVLSTYSWMMPYSMIGLVIKPEEQGNWAATTAKAILNGFDIQKISITTNKTWNSYLNIKLLEKTDIKIPRAIFTKFKKYQMD